LLKDDVRGSTLLLHRQALVLPPLVKLIFVHGWFWHRHTCKEGQRRPKSQQDYWTPKIDGNVQRDRKARRRLRRDGWGVLVVWECQTRDADRLAARLQSFLER